MIGGSLNGDIIKPKRKYLNNSFDNTVNLFSEDYHKNLPVHHKTRKEVNKNIYDSGYAGVKTNYNTLEAEKLDKTASNFINYLKRIEYNIHFLNSYGRPFNNSNKTGNFSKAGRTNNFPKHRLNHSSIIC